ncbi:glycosyltransferase [Salinisphaera sp. RV14]|uniref:glycosyltransferase n=1 Tax=unclassified Salinisphaera TaxID=2649847 RepID=UPI003F866AE9
MRIALYSANIDAGGVWSFTRVLATALVARGYTVDMVVARLDPSRLALVPHGVHTFPLTKSSSARGLVDALRAFPRDAGWLARACLEGKGATRQIRSVASLTRYLQQRQPDVLIANLWQCAVSAVRARALASTHTRIVTVEHSDSWHRPCPGDGSRAARRSVTARMVGRIHARADARVAVSAALARSFEKAVDLPMHAVQTIHNPVVDSTLLDGMRRPVDHPWFGEADTPVIVAVGRLHPQKGFDVLIDAFACVRRRRTVRLAILGDGAERSHLEARAAQAGLADDIAFMGWVDHPAAFMARSAMLVSASRLEGLPYALIEALASGCPVVATDCPSGPAEVLGHGRYGRLVAVDDIAGLSAAIEQTLDSPPDKALMEKRAADFSVEKSVDRYETLICGLWPRYDRRSPPADVVERKIQ